MVILISFSKIKSYRTLNIKILQAKEINLFLKKLSPSFEELNGITKQHFIRLRGTLQKTKTVDGKQRN